MGFQRPLHAAKTTCIQETYPMRHQIDAMGCTELASMTSFPTHFPEFLRTAPPNYPMVCVPQHITARSPDKHTLLAAQRLTALAYTADEKVLAQEAYRSTMMLPGSQVELYGMKPTQKGYDRGFHPRSRSEMSHNAMERRTAMHTPCHSRPWIGAEPGLTKGSSPWRTRDQALWEKRNSDPPPGHHPDSPERPGRCAHSPPPRPRDVSMPYLREDSTCKALKRERRVMACRRSPWDVERFSGDHYWPDACRSKLLDKMDAESPTNLAWIGRQPMRKNRLTTKETQLTGDELRALEKRAWREDARSNAGRGGSPYKNLFAATANSNEFGPGETRHSLESWERRKWSMTQRLPSPTGFTDDEMDVRGLYTDYDTATPLTSPYATTQGSVWFQNTQGSGTFTPTLQPMIDDILLQGPPGKQSHRGSEAAFPNTQRSVFYSTQASLPRMEEPAKEIDAPVLETVVASDTDGSLSPEQRAEKEEHMVAHLKMRVEAATGEIYNEPVA